MSSRASRRSRIGSKRETTIINLPETEDLDAGEDDRYSDYAESDDEFPLPIDFNEHETREKLFHFENCSQIVLSLEQQRDMAIEIGVNVTAEHPWKQVNKDLLSDYMEFDDPVKMEFKTKLTEMTDGEMVLIGYAASLSEDEDTFLFFNDSTTAKEASLLIEQLEAFERLRAKRSLIKQPRKWKSLGSEKDVDLFLVKQKLDVVDVEVQSVFPVLHSHKPFQLRLADDARDGYLELVPRKNVEFININRKRVDMFVQSAPPRVHLEQQTDPTFPTNAWSQYLYEIGQDKTDSVADDDDEPVKKKRGAKTPEPETILPTHQVAELIESLQFNAVDMYKNDYPYITKVEIPKFKMPYLKEMGCFVDMAKSLNRYVCSVDWHPVYSGLMLVSYTFSTLSTIVNNNDKTDLIKRAVLQPNPVLMWGFDDSLHPKLEFETSREITCLSYCPYDANLVLGGTINGQLIIWDMRNCLQKVEAEEILTAAQMRYRSTMRSFLHWTKQDNQDRIVRPVALSALQTSHKAPITDIQWLNRKYYVAVTGNIKENPSGLYRFVVTASLDCTIAFWDMDFNDENETRKAAAAKKKCPLPAEMMQDVSEYERLNRILRPEFVIVYNRPVTSMILDSATFIYDPIDEPPKRTLRTRVSHAITDVPLESFAERIVAASFMGSLSILAWNGSERGAEIIKKEFISKAEKYAQIHDGPILSVERNPFAPELFLSVGRNVLSMWSNDLSWTPIFWRRRSAQLTACRWSRNRPSVFFLSRADGNFEAWDIMTRTDEPCLIDSLGGSTLSCLAQHKLSLPQEAIVVGDFNSSLRLLVIPPGFTVPLSNELESLKEFVEKEVNRKDSLFKWQTAYYASNADIREAKKKSALDAQAELLRLEKEMKDAEEIRLRKEENEQRRAKAKEKNKAVYDLPERLEKKWDEMNIKRLMKVLMSMKMVDPKILALWTKPEKDRIAYNARKQTAIELSFAKVNDDIAHLRARLLPVEKNDEDRMGYVRQNLQIISLSDDAECQFYQQLEQKAIHFINTHSKRASLSFRDILHRSGQRREVINKSLGSNTQHRHTYFSEKNKHLPLRRVSTVEAVALDEFGNIVQPTEVEAFNE